MKKTAYLFAVLLLTAFVFAFAGCSGENENGAVTDSTEENTPSSQVVEENIPELPSVSLTADKTEAAPGEELTVKFGIKGAVNLTSLTANLKYDNAQLTYSDAEAYGENGFYNIFNEHDSVVEFQGYVLNTISFEDETLLTVTFSVNDDAVSGSEIPLSLELAELSLSEDESGDEYSRYEEYIEPVSLTIKVR